jgi:hypothetical protein
MTYLPLFRAETPYSPAPQVHTQGPYSQPKLVLIYRLRRDERLSWPEQMWVQGNYPFLFWSPVLTERDLNPVPPDQQADVLTMPPIVWHLPTPMTWETATWDVTVRTLYCLWRYCHAGAVALLDSSAAFDKVDQAILLDRLRISFSVHNRAHDWIRSYLLGRTQRVRWGGSSSTVARVLCGVPQRSVLGQLLCIIYTLDLPAVASTFGLSLHQYTDDIQWHICICRRMFQTALLPSHNGCALERLSPVHVYRHNLTQLEKKHTNCSPTYCILFPCKTQRLRPEFRVLSTFVSINSIRYELVCVDL